MKVGFSEQNTKKYGGIEYAQELQYVCVRQQKKPHSGYAKII